MVQYSHSRVTCTKAACPECDIPQMARNHYFTGKLLVERDFTDEQRYLLGKVRRHNQRLHGWGAVCGLKVKQHPNPACQSRFVLIEPGMAVDCCGREIVVAQEEPFDFHARFLANWQQQHGPDAQPDGSPHTLQVCVSYKECPTEETPVLFDDCAGTASCQPNRILESCEFDVRIDPPPTPADAAGVRLDWTGTINLGSPLRAAVHDATGRLYVLAADGGAATLYAVDTANGSVVGSQAFAQTNGLDVAVSPAGDFVYVAVLPTSGGAAVPQVLVLAAGDLAQTINTLTPPGGAAADVVRLAVAADGRLLALYPSAGVFVWNTDLNEPNPPAPAPAQTIAVGAGPIDLAVSADGRYACVANQTGGDVSIITLADGTVTAVPVGTAGGAAPSAVAIATTTGGSLLAVLDSANAALYFIRVPAAGPGSAVQAGGTKNFAKGPIGVRLSPGGRWAYVLEEDAAAPQTGYLQAVDVHAAELNGPHVLGDPIPVGLLPTGAFPGQDGARLYVTYGGAAPAVPGAVAVVEVTPADCADIFRQTVEGCPACVDGNCIVLATVTGYVYDAPVTDAEIDNFTDRHLLPSTDVLAQAIRCLLEQEPGGGKAGEQGPPGPAGTDGTNGTNGANGARGPTGPTGPTGPGLQTGLTRIRAVSWEHGGPGALVVEGMERTESLALIIMFTEEIDILPQIDKHVFEVLCNNPRESNEGLLECRCAVLGKYVAVFIDPNTDVAGDLVKKAVPTNTNRGNGVACLLSRKLLEFERQSPLELWVRLRGDFVLDDRKRAVSAEFVRAQFPTGDQPAGSGLSLEGGLFESWFNGVPRPR